MKTVLVGSGDPTTWRIPKGMQNAGETIEQTACREVREETGFSVNHLALLGSASWMYRYDGRDWDETCHFFAMQLASEISSPNDGEYERVEWCPIHLAAERLHYEAEKQIAVLAMDYVQTPFLSRLRGMRMNVGCLALLGPPGCGKSTASRGIERLCASRGIYFRLLKFAEPLYRCQATIYEVAGRPLTDFYAQDGELLNFLGSHLRKINGQVLLDDFDRRLRKELETLEVAEGTDALIICDDMRQSEAAYLKSRAFRFVRLSAPPAICTERQRARGDMTLGAADHVTECGLETVPAEHVVSNSGTLDDLQRELSQLLGSIFT